MFGDQASGSAGAEGLAKLRALISAGALPPEAAARAQDALEQLEWATLPRAEQLDRRSVAHGKAHCAARPGAFSPMCRPMSDAELARRYPRAEFFSSVRWQLGTRRACSILRKLSCPQHRPDVRTAQ